MPTTFLKLCNLQVSPVDLYPSPIVDLKGDASCGFTDFGIFKPDHGFAIQPGFDQAADYADLHFIPFAIFERFVFLRLWLDQPSTAIRLINTSRVVTRRRHLGLPACDLGSFYGAAEKDAAVAICFLFEFRSQFK